MTTPTVLIATGSDGLFILTGDTTRHEFPGRPVCGLARAERGEALAILDGHIIGRVTASGASRTVAELDASLSCCQCGCGPRELVFGDGADRWR